MVVRLFNTDEVVLLWIIFRRGMKPVHRVVVVGENCDVVVVVAGGEGNKHKVPKKNRHVAIILLCL